MDQKIAELEDRMQKLENEPGKPWFHVHNGTDMNGVTWVDVTNKRVFIHHTIQGTAAATAANYGVFFIAPVALRLVTLREVHQTAGSDAGTVSLTLEKLTGTQAPDAGVAMLTAALSLKATANTIQSGTVTLTLANRSLAIGDRVCMLDAGILTAVANVTVVAEFQLL